jgi:PTH1 family peptidyl-tRNA hydrolase
MVNGDSLEAAKDIKAIIGLGNPGLNYYYQRHTIGFRVVDALAEKFGGYWKTKGNMDVAVININNHETLLIKPLTFMNSSGQIVPQLQRQGIKSENMLVVHDELELPFGQIKLKFGGSHRGHNGLRSIITVGGDQFWRMRIGINRPAQKEEVPDYVLQPFSEKKELVDGVIQDAMLMIEQLFA